MQALVCLAHVLVDSGAALDLNFDVVISTTCLRP